MVYEFVFIALLLKTTMLVDIFRIVIAYEAPEILLHPKYISWSNLSNTLPSKLDMFSCGRPHLA